MTRTRARTVTLTAHDLARVTGGCTFEDLISAFAVPQPAPQSVTSPRDSASGLPTGK